MAILVDYHLVAQPMLVKRDSAGQIIVDPEWQRFMSAGGELVVAMNRISAGISTMPDPADPNKPITLGPWLNLYSGSIPQDGISNTKGVVERDLDAKGWLRGAKIDGFNSPIWVPVGNRHMILLPLLEGNQHHVRTSPVEHAGQQYELPYQVLVRATFLELVPPPGV